MGLEKLKSRKAESADYMTSEITKIIKTYGKRDPGGQGETDAINYMADELRKYSDEVKVEPFDLHPGAFFGWIYLTVSFVLIAFVLLFVQPIISIVLIVLATSFMIGEFIMYREYIDVLFKKKVSHNLTAVKKPSGEVKRRVFINGHPDAACEWTVNYHLGGVGFGAHFVYAIAGLVYVTVIAVLAIINKGIGDGALRIAGLCTLVFLPGWIGMYFLSNSRKVVDGANDNLTGCYMGISILKALHDEGINLENTEVGVILSGSEEAGLRGAKAWVKAHKDEYKDVETLIFSFDTIRESDFLQVNKLDLNNTVKADAHASNLFKQSADNAGIKCSIGTVPFGATDSAAFNQGGFAATGITAMDHNLRDYYHTRRDTYDNLDAKCLADTYEVMVGAIELFDQGK